MVKINIVYENLLNDVDIIAVSNEIALDIVKIGQEFLDWLPSAEDDDYWTTIDGKRYNVCETDGFIKWLNSSYCKGVEKAFVVKEHTNYCSDYKMIEF